MRKLQFRVLYREFLFRIVDVELLSAHAEGDSRKLLGQFASILLFCSMVLAIWGGLWAAGARGEGVPALARLAASWTAEHILIATTMLVVGLFAVLSWDSTFPDKHDVLVLGPLPIRARTLFFAKVAAVGAALGMTIVTLHAAAGLAWPFALASFDSAPAPALAFDPALPPLRAPDAEAVLGRDIAPLIARLDLAANDGGAGIVVGVSEHGRRRILTYGAAQPDSLFEIGSITKTMTGLLLAKMAVQRKLDLRDHVRDLLPPGAAPAPAGPEIQLVDLATHHSGLPRMPDNTGPGNRAESYTGYHAADLYEFVKRHGLAKPPGNSKFLYSNLGYTILGAALANRAEMPYPELLRREITGPLGLDDTAIALSPEQRSRFLTGHDPQRRATPPWELDAFASAGGVRSTAGDMLTYLEAQLHPERSPLRAAIVESQRPRAIVSGNVRIGLAWIYDPDKGVYVHDGATGGYTAFSAFSPERDWAAVVMMNAAPAAYPFVPVLGQHLMDRLSGRPALSLALVMVPAAGPVRSLLAYWITMAAAGAFMFCCVLALQGFAAELLPRRWFLRVSAVLQLAVFCLLVTGYFLQRSPTAVLVAGPHRSWISWVPSYWFVGLYQQLSGSLHPALAPFAWRAWIGLFAAVLATAAAYAASYLRTLRKVVEEPDIAPALRSAWLPRFGRPFETAIVHFSIRSLLRSRRHRMIFAFYLGAALAFSILFVNAPSELAGPTSAADTRQPTVPLLAATIMITGLWIFGARVAFSLPLDLPANWIFRVMPFAGGPAILRARRRALFAVSVIPAWTLCAAALFAACPWKPAAAHTAILALLGIFLAEFSWEGTLKIPFACSYLPGRSNFHVTFVLWLYMLLFGVIGCAVGEREILARPAAAAMLIATLAFAALLAFLRSNRLAAPGEADLRYEEELPDRVLTIFTTQ